MSRVKGDRSIPHRPLAAPAQYRWTRGGGTAEQIWYEGKYGYLKDTILPSLVDDFDSITIQQVKGDWYRLDAAQNGEEVTELHEVSGSNLSQSVLINLIMKQRFVEAGFGLGLAEAAFLSAYNKAVSEIANAVANYKSNPTESDAYLTMQAAAFTAVGEVSGPISDVAMLLVDELIRYGDQFLHAQYSYRHTIIVPERSQFDLGDIYANTHRVFTESKLRNDESIPQGFKLPKKISDNMAGAMWLKQPASSSMSVGQRRQAVLEYLAADEWRTLKYANAI